LENDSRHPGHLSAVWLARERSDDRRRNHNSPPFDSLVAQTLRQGVGVNFRGVDDSESFHPGKQAMQSFREPFVDGTVRSAIHKTLEPTLGWWQPSFLHQPEELGADVRSWHSTSKELDKSLLYPEHERKFRVALWIIREIIFLKCNQTAHMNHVNRFSHDG